MYLGWRTVLYMYVCWILVSILSLSLFLRFFYKFLEPYVRCGILFLVYNWYLTINTTGVTYRYEALTA
jgi:hypothetical protein